MLPYRKKLKRGLTWNNYFSKWKHNLFKEEMLLKRKNVNRHKLKEKCSSSWKKKNKNNWSYWQKKRGKRRSCLKKKNNTTIYKKKLRIVGKLLRNYARN